MTLALSINVSNEEELGQVVGKSGNSCLTWSHRYIWSNVMDCVGVSGAHGSDGCCEPAGGWCVFSDLDDILVPHMSLSRWGGKVYPTQWNLPHAQGRRRPPETAQDRGITQARSRYVCIWRDPCGPSKGGVHTWGHNMDSSERERFVIILEERKGQVKRISTIRGQSK